MTQIDDIRARLERVRLSFGFGRQETASGMGPTVFADIAALLAEVDRLAGQLERAKTILNTIAHNPPHCEGPTGDTFCALCGSIDEYAGHNDDCPSPLSRALLAELDVAK